MNPIEMCNILEFYAKNVSPYLNVKIIMTDEDCKIQTDVNYRYLDQRMCLCKNTCSHTRIRSPIKYQFSMMNCNKHSDYRQLYDLIETSLETYQNSYDKIILYNKTANDSLSLLNEKIIITEKKSIQYIDDQFIDEVIKITNIHIKDYHNKKYAHESYDICFIGGIIFIIIIGIYYLALR